MSQTTSASTHNSSLSGGGIAGAVVGAVLGAVMVGLGAFCLGRRLSQKNMISQDQHEKGQLEQSYFPHGDDHPTAPRELNGDGTQTFELPGKARTQE